MSRLLGKAKQMVTRTAGDVLDQLRPSSRQSRSASPAPVRQDELPVNPDPLQGSFTAATTATQSPMPLKVVSTSSLDSAGPTVHPQSPPLPSDPAVIPPHARAPSDPSILATAGSAIKGLLVAARDGSDLLLPLKAALVGVVALWDICDRTAEAKAEFTKLESKLNAINAIAAAHREEIDDDLQVRLVAIVQAIGGLWEAVEGRQARGGVARVVQSAIDLGDIKTLNSAISSLIELFQFEGGIAMQKELGLISKRLDATDSERKQSEYLKKQEKAIKTIKSLLGDNFLSEAADDEQPSYTGCMTGTRVGVLSKFMAWVKDDPMAIFWLSGMAGTGKTSVAVSLCRILREDPAVHFGGGYFCSRTAGSIARTDVRRILPTLAVLLAESSRKFAEALAAELEVDRRVGHKPVGEQIDPLLRIPLAAIAPSARPVVFVIDALDECDDEREMTEFLRLIADLACNVKLKFILTSRPELHIRGTPISTSAHNTILQLHTISVDEVTSDIRLYVQGTLKYAASGATWYTDQDVDLLVELSAGLFIFASTVLKYVLHRNEDDDRQDRLRKATLAGATHTAATNAVDKVYELILMEASRSDTIDDEELERMRNILACILTARMTLSVEALAALINITASRLRGALERLHSLVYIPAGDKQTGIRTLHASFGDYLLERGPTQIRIPATLGHDLLAHGCLRRMAANDLCFNIAHSRSSYEPSPETMTNSFALSIVYACLHWAHHIDSASNRSAFDTEIGQIFRPKFLFWLEMLSILGKTGLASGLLRIAGSAVHDSVVSEFLRDANAFVASSHGAISRSVPHIYLSALPFAAKDSLIYRDFASFCTPFVSATTAGIDRRCGRLVATLTGHNGDVRSVTYSPDGRLLASCSDDTTVRIWDTRTGEEIMSPLQGDDDGVSSIAFGPDGRRIVSGTLGGLVYVWNVTTGRAAMHPLRCHSDMVLSVAYSPDGTLIASASYDGEVRLWNSETGVEVFVMKGHTDRVNAVGFSSDGRLLASASHDKTIRLWNSLTGQAVGVPLVGLQDVVLCLSFSPDGKWLAAGSMYTYVVRTWDVATQKLSSIVIRDQSSVQSLAFSPDSSILILSGRSTIRCWDPHSGRELCPASFAGHSDWVRSVAFSPDGRFLASSSADQTVRIWDAVIGVESAVQPLKGHSSVVYSVAVTSDNNCIVSGSVDCSVRVWDVKNGQEKRRSLSGYGGMVTSVAISPSAHLIASASADQTVRLWDMATGKPISEPLRGHTDVVNTVAFSPDAQWLVSGSDDNSVRIWEVATRREATFGPLLCSEKVSAIAFSPDGQLLAAVDHGGYVYLWQLGTDQMACTPLQATITDIHCISFSPDSTRFVIGVNYSSVGVWDISVACQVLELKGHTNWIRSVAYSPEGRYIASASSDRTVRLWNSVTGDSISTFFGHSDWVLSVAFTPDGRSIVSGSSDTTIHVWDIEAARMLASRAKHDTLAALGSATLTYDGWLVGPSGELLLWLPVEYRGYVLLPPCSMIIGGRRVILEAESGGRGLHRGDQWTACWRDATHPVVRPS